MKARIAVGPEDHPAAVAGRLGIGRQAGCRAHDGRIGVTRGSLALEIAADQDFAAAGFPRCVDSGGAENGNPVAGDDNAAARIVTGGGIYVDIGEGRIAAACPGVQVARAGLVGVGGDRHTACRDTCSAQRNVFVAGYFHRPAGGGHLAIGRYRARAAGAENDFAAPALDRVGIDHAVGVDDVTDDGFHVAGGEAHDSAAGQDAALIVDEILDRVAVGIERRLGDADPERDQVVAIKVDGKRVRRAERYPAEPGIDDAGIPDMGGHERGIPGIADADLAFVDDTGLRVQRRNGEFHASRHEIFVADIGRGRDQARYIDAGSGAEHDAVGIDQEDTAVGAQRAENVGRVCPGDAVERDGARGGLMELRRFTGRDGERPPVDNRAVGGLVDIDAIAGMFDGGGAVGHGAALRVCEGREGDGSGQDHAEDQPQSDVPGRTEPAPSGTDPVASAVPRRRARGTGTLDH